MVYCNEENRETEAMRGSSEKKEKRLSSSPGKPLLGETGKKKKRRKKRGGPFLSKRTKKRVYSELLGERKRKWRGS